MNVGLFGTPGHSAAVFSSESEILWGGDESRIHVMRASRQFSSAAADAGSTPTSVIRKGMIMGRLTASAKCMQWDATATDGSQNIDGVLGVELAMYDALFVAADRFGSVIVRAPLKAKSLLIKGSALIGHTDEYLARRRLAQLGFTLDDDAQNYLSGLTPRVSLKATDYTVVAADNGTVFQADTANATFTLPALKAGLNFEFVRLSDHNLVVASAAGDDIVVGNDLQADSVTYSTAGNKIGARIRVQSVYHGSTLRWLAEIVPPPFSTGAFLTQTLAT